MSKKIFTVLLACLFVFTANSYALSLIGHWGFEEGSGSIAGDSSANNNDGTIYSPSWTNGGAVGKALSFNGYDSLVNCTDAPEFDNLSNVTIAAWINGSWFQGGNGYYSAIAGKEGLYKIDMAGSKVRFLTGNNWAGSILNSNTSLQLDTWYHIAATYDGSVKNLYINGQLDNSLNTTGELGSNTWPLLIGAQIEWQSGGYEDFFAGKIDEVRLYDYALSQSEVQALVPEPVTIALLGLGGLMIGRKK